MRTGANLGRRTSICISHLFRRDGLHVQFVGEDVPVLLWQACLPEPFGIKWVRNAQRPTSKEDAGARAFKCLTYERRLVRDR
jgi:hypothetical protein